jgi:hypothetical protein
MATMAEQIDEQRKMISDLTARIEGLEKRQAKLVIEQYQDEEDGLDDWDRLADMLGFETTPWVLGWLDANYTAFPNLDKYAAWDYAFKCMLIGMVCEECNGWIHEYSAKWVWGFLDNDGCDYGGDKDSRPDAAIAMLKAYRESSDE